MLDSKHSLRFVSWMASAIAWACWRLLDLETLIAIRILSGNLDCVGLLEAVGSRTQSASFDGETVYQELEKQE
jgi:hypothetical protein